MKRLLLSLAILALGLLPGRVFALDTQDFRIDSFTADYRLSRNPDKESLLKVDEEIVAVFPDYDQNHGILRAIPETYKNHSLSLEIESVKNDKGINLPYTTDSQNDNRVLKIGDANSFVHGIQEYIISYTMKNIITYYDDHDELFWDINGDQWNQPFGTVTARIYLSDDVSPHLQDRQVCYAGPYGSTESDCSVTEAIGDGLDRTERIITVTAKDLAPGESLSVVLGFDKGTFEQGASVKQAETWQLVSLLIGLAGLGLLPLGTAVFIYKRWRKYGRDPKGRGVIVPQYQRPKGLSLMTAGMILEEKVTPKAVSASLIDLAVRRYIMIYETETRKGLFGKAKEYELELLKDAHDLSEEEQRLVRAIFGSTADVGKRKSLDNLKAKLYENLKKIDKKIGNDLAGRMIFRRAPHEARTRYMTTGILLAVVGLLGTFFGGSSGLGVVGMLMTGLLLSGLMLIFSGRIMPARTKKGVEARDYLLGMKDYIKLAEAERLRYLQSPSGAEKIELNHGMKVKLFEKLLPFAMLFGLEKDWAEEFRDLYAQPPEWYHGNWTTFNTIYLVSSISNLSSVSSAAFSAPRSSGSSGFGGGFSGGGGGGGGGGGW